MIFFHTNASQATKTIFLLFTLTVLTACDTKNPNQLNAANTSDQVKLGIVDYHEKYKIPTDPIERSELIVRVMGSTAREDTHSFLKFHVYGFTGDGNVIPFFSMNNYIIQKWTPKGPGHYSLEHYEVAYYSEFDTEEAISEWTNPVTGETVDIPHFILGPIYREYTPEGIIARGIAPNPLAISIIGDRVFIPAQSVDTNVNPMLPEEWGAYSSGPTIYWDSMLTYSANVEEAFDPAVNNAHAEIHMQNMVSWASYMKMGQRPGRTMVRAYGQNISGFDALPDKIRENLKTYTPDIFETDSWDTLKLDAIDFMVELMEKKAKGELVIEIVPDQVQ